jgi:8-oxo-dGTP pyrophosphatase MutT (NUDIX family)
LPEGRGGQQVIPRPPGSLAGGPAPWADLPDSERRPTIADVRRAFDLAGPAVPSPLEATQPRASAVLAPLYEAEGETWVVLTRRSADLRSHKGEVSFPGGGQEPGEALLDTALREAFEETGLDPGTVDVIGEIDHLSTVTSRSFIVPFVGVLPSRPEMVPNPGEVDAILHVPLRELLQPDIWREELWRWESFERPIWFFELVGDTVWGATAAMLRQLLGLVTGTVDRGQMIHE